MIRNRAARGMPSWPCLAAAALASLVPPGPAVAQGPVVSEMSISPPRGYPQFIEIQNPSVERADLAGWRISGTAEHVFPPGASIEPLGFLVLAAGAAEFEAAYGFPPDGEFPGFFVEDEAAITLAPAPGAVQFRAVHRLDPASPRVGAAPRWSWWLPSWTAPTRPRGPRPAGSAALPAPRTRGDAASRPTP